MVQCAVFCGLITINGVLATSGIIARRQVEAETNALVTEVIDTGETMPNIYMLLFDEYSTTPVMEKYFSYDNSAF